MPISTVGANGLNRTEDFVIDGLTVGKGGGNSATNTVVGAGSLTANTTGTGNDVFGSLALPANTTGNNNSAFGRGALLNNTTGGSNSAFGYNSAALNTSGSNNVSVGWQSLFSNTTASDNTAVGYQSLYTNTTGTAVTALGYKAGYSSNGSVSVYVGYNCGVNATGSSNTFIGSGAGEAVTSGAKNTIVGRYNGNQGGLDIRTASNRIVLSDGDGNPYAYWGSTGQATFRSVGVDNLLTLTSSAGAFSSRIQLDCTGGGGAVVASTSNVLTCQTGGTGGVTLNSGATAWVSASDERVKENLQEITNAANKVASLRAVTGNYTWDESKKSRAFLIAQDVLEVLPEAVETKNPDELGLAYTDVIPLLVAAIKELNAKVATLEAKLASK
jgi:trimeric autotransporter adhesin